MSERGAALLPLPLLLFFLKSHVRLTHPPPCTPPPLSAYRSPFLCFSHTALTSPSLSLFPHSFLLMDSSLISTYDVQLHTHHACLLLLMDGFEGLFSHRRKVGGCFAVCQKNQKFIITIIFPNQLCSKICKNYYIPS